MWRRFPGATSNKVVEYRILGPVEIADDTGSLPLGGQKQRALLALLLLNAGAVVSTDRLVDQLWGEQPPKTAMTSLQNLVSQLRKLLGAGRARDEAAGLRAPGRVASSSISAASSGLVARARRTEPERAGRGSCARRSRSGAARRSRTSHSRRSPRSRSGGSRSSGWTRSRSGSTPISSWARRASSSPSSSGSSPSIPLRERLRGQLMLALYRAGRQAEALQVYLDARRALVDELGIEPSPALQQLYRSILRQEVVLERAPPPAAAGDHFGDVAKALIGGRLVVVLGAGDQQYAGSNGDGLPVVGGVGRPPGEDVRLSVGACPRPSARRRVRRADEGRSAPSTTSFTTCSTASTGRARSIGRSRRSPAILRDRGAPHQLIVTTSFDETLERAFGEVGEEFDVVVPPRGRPPPRQVPPRGSGRRSDARRRSERLRRPVARSAYGDPQDPRRHRPSARAASGRASSSARTITSTTSRRPTSRRRSR